MKKTAITLVAAILFFVVVMQITIKMMPYFAPSQYGRGNLFFADAENISSIVIKKDSHKIKLRKSDGNWYCNGYYAQNALMDDYIKNLSQVTIADNFSARLKDKAEVEFTTANGKKFFFETAVDGNRSVVSLDNKNYLLNKNIMLPITSDEYYIQPLLPLADKQIEKQVGVNGDKDIFYSIRYLGAVKSIPDSSADSQYKNFALISSDGIKFVCGLYKNKEQYWMTVNLKTTIMPTIEADKYVKTNGFRYDGWYFMISTEEGNRLWNLLTN